MALIESNVAVGSATFAERLRGRTRAFLAGPPLLKAATGEVASEEELGGAELHTQVSGLGDHLAEDDRDAIRIAREIMAKIDWPLGVITNNRPIDNAGAAKATHFSRLAARAARPSSTSTTPPATWWAARPSRAA